MVKSPESADAIAAAEPTQPFRYVDYGNLATVGRKAAIVDLAVPALGAIRDFGEYIRGMVEERRHATRESDLVRLLLDASDGDVLSEDELTAMFVVLLFDAKTRQSIPLLGDLFDVAFKANVRNVRLLRRWMDKQR